MIPWRAIAAKFGFDIPLGKMEEPIPDAERMTLLMRLVAMIIVALTVGFILGSTTVVSPPHAVDVLSL